MSISKKISLILFSSIIIAIFFLLPASAEAGYCWSQKECTKVNGQWVNKTNNECISEFGFCYPPEKEVTLQVPIGQLSKASNITQYIPAVYSYMISIVSIVAVVMIMIGGLRYLTAGGNQQSISKAKENIVGSIVGLFLVLGSYILLQTINPALVKLELPRIRMIAPEGVTQWCKNDGAYEGKFKCGESYNSTSNPPSPNGAVCTGGHCPKLGNEVLGCNKIVIKYPSIASGVKDIIFPPMCISDTIGKILTAIDTKLDKCGGFKERGQCIQTSDSEIIITKDIWSKYNQQSNLVSSYVGKGIITTAIIDMWSKLPYTEFFTYKDSNESLHISMCSPKAPSVSDSVCGPSLAGFVLKKEVMEQINKDTGINRDESFLNMLKEAFNIK